MDDEEHKQRRAESEKEPTSEEEDDDMHDEEHERRRRQREWVTTNELGGDALSVLNDDTNDPLEKKSEEEVCAWAFMAMQAIQQSTQPNSIKQAYERTDAKLYDIAIKKEII